MRFNVAVGEGEITGAVVVRARQIAPHIFIQHIEEEAIIEGIGVFIQEEKDSCGLEQFIFLEELNIGWIEPIGQLAGIAYE